MQQMIRQKLCLKDKAILYVIPLSKNAGETVSSQPNSCGISNGFGGHWITETIYLY